MADTLEKIYQRPIPGQFATDPIGKYPFDRPPEVTDPQEALEKVWKGLSNPDNVVTTLELMNKGVTVDTLVNSLLQSLFGEGKVHIMALPLMVPSLIEMFTFIAEEAGVTPLFREDAAKKKVEDISEKDLELFVEEIEEVLDTSGTEEEEEEGIMQKPSSQEEVS